MPPIQRKKTVFQRQGDPYLYLFTERQWYCYDPHEEPLGSGAMGTVWRGYNVDTGEQIAVKRVKDEYVNIPIIRERARLESSMAFRHQNLIEMIGCCMVNPDRGPIWLLSKFVSGQEIDKYVKQITEEQTKVETTAHAICQVLDALKYIHANGIIHRDIKPSNIMVEDNSNVRLMDLGIARMSGGNKFSQSGFIGTPQYAAPEQITRDGNSTIPINAATDIYSLGVTFYELLTGVNPFDSESEMETLTRQMRDPLPKSDLIPKRLMQVLLKATEKEQPKRYQTAAEFQEAIIAALAQPPTFWQRIRNMFSKKS